MGKTLSCEKGMEMTDDGTKVTLRMGPEEIQMMEDFMAEHEIGNRSDFIRDAIRGYIDAQKNGGALATSESGIFVRFSDLHLNAIQGCVKLGMAYDEEEFVRKTVIKEIMPEDIQKEVIANSFRNALMNADLK